jgi:hypothetical protein
MKNLSCWVLLGLTLQILTGCQPPTAKVPAPPSAPPPPPGVASTQSGPILAPPERGDATPVIAAALQNFGTVRLMDGATFRLSSSVRLASGQGLVGNAILVPEFDRPVESGMANAAILIEGNDVKIEGLTIRKPFKEKTSRCTIWKSPATAHVTESLPSSLRSWKSQDAPCGIS